MCISWYIFHSVCSIDRSYGFVAALSVSVTFIGTSVLSSLVTLLLTCLYVRGRDKKAASTTSAPLYEVPSPDGSKALLKMSPCAAYGQVEPQSTAEGNNTYESMAL